MTDQDSSVASVFSLKPSPLPMAHSFPMDVPALSYTAHSSSAQNPQFHTRESVGIHPAWILPPWTSPGASVLVRAMPEHPLPFP